MTNFGIIKSKIEDVLLESYKNDTFKEEFKKFGKRSRNKETTVDFE